MQIIVKWIAFEQSINRTLDALSDRKQLNHGLGAMPKLASWPILSISGNDDTTSPHQSFQGTIYDCSTHSSLWYINFIIIPSFACPKFICIELLISLHNDQHLFADGFVRVGPITMKFGWDQENVSSLKLRKFHLNPSNFTRELMMLFKLDLKNITLTAFRPPV